jgi:hypothetical protein
MLNLNQGEPPMTEAELNAIERCCPATSGQDVADLVAEVRRLRGIIEGLAARVARQSELLARRAERGNGETTTGTAKEKS